MKKEWIYAKKGQITIFIILAIILVVAIAMVFIFFSSKQLNIDPEKPETLIKNLESCITKSFEDYNKNYFSYVLINSSRAEYFTYKENKILIMCDSMNSKEVCVNKHPALANEIATSLEKYFNLKIESCFNKLKSSLPEYTEKPLTLKIEILPAKISFKINKTISYAKREGRYTIEDFDFMLNSNLFDFIRIITEIVNEETEKCSCSKSCNADIMRLNRENLDFTITKPYYAYTGEEVYSVLEQISKKEINFVVKNCV